MILNWSLKVESCRDSEEFIPLAVKWPIFWVGWSQDEKGVFLLEVDEGVQLGALNLAVERQVLLFDENHEVVDGDRYHRDSEHHRAHTAEPGSGFVLPAYEEGGRDSIEVERRPPAFLLLFFSTWGGLVGR